ncbi:MAG: AAA family ATPase, partial [Leptospira sp.]|nr:AAA family ATPase [Leptospira sp.]
MSDNLFPGKFHEPLAHRLRPENFEEIIGQKKTISLLKKIKKPLSLILYGPPGTGKTTISKILSRSWNLEFKTLSAISSGVKEIRDLALETEKRGTMVLFLDEIHRFSTSQQDTLLEVVEKGQVILIGATTENPAYRINRPLLSRCQIFKLDALSEGELTELMHRALSKEKLILQFDIESEKYIVNSAGGDGRRLLGILEGLMNVERDSDAITLPIVKNFLDAQVLTYDKNKENHYDFISAFIKSIRGSDPDASVYYLAAMLA